MTGIVSVTMELAEKNVDEWKTERMHRAALVLDALYGLEEISLVARERVVADRARDYLAAWWSEKKILQSIDAYQKEEETEKELLVAIDEANQTDNRDRDKWISWVLESFDDSLVTVVSTR